MMRTVRSILVFAAATFVAAAAVHFGALLDGYGHVEAGRAETVIALVLFAGFALTWAPAPWARRTTIAAQAFAIAGVLVGLFTIAVGVGPRTAGDVIYHVAVLAVLGAGLAMALGLPRPERATGRAAGRSDRRRRASRRGSGERGVRGLATPEDERKEERLWTR